MAKFLKTLIAKISGIALILIGLPFILVSSQITGPDASAFVRYGLNVAGWVFLGTGFGLLSYKPKNDSETSPPVTEEPR